MFFVASSAAIDQYIVTHPDYLLKQSPENALLNPDNLYILLSHFKCAAFELPFAEGDGFGNAPGTEELLAYLNEEGIVHEAEGKYHWSAEDFPASEISLRSAAEENFIIIDITDPARHRVVGEMDRFTAPMLLHENAIYMHEGRQFQVEKLDFDACKAYIRAVEVGYYTDADLNINLSLLDVEKEEDTSRGGRTGLGEIKVTALVTMFKKIKFDTHETLGWGHVRLPETDMHTTAMWWTLPKKTVNRYASDTLKNGMLGIANLLRIVCPLYLMCAPQDIAVVYQVKSPMTGEPTLLLYDNCPGGIGLSHKAYGMQDLLLEKALQVAGDCGCKNGCPSCTGPVGEIGQDGKKTAMAILRELTE